MEKFKLAKLNDKDSILSKTWYVYYSYKHPETHKFQLFQVYISNKLKTKKARYQRADEVIEAINLKLNKGWSPYLAEDQTLMTLDEAAQKFLEIKKTEIRPRSFHTYNSIINLFLSWCETKKLNTKPIDIFNYNNAIDFLDFLKIKKKLTNRSHNNYRRALNTFFIWMQNRDYIEYNPWKRTVRLTQEQPELIAFTPEELKIIRKNLPKYNDRLWMVAQLIFYCFLRPQEIVRLRFGDFNIPNSRIQINGSQSKNRNSQLLMMPKAFVSQINPDQWKGNPDMFIFSGKLLPGKKQINPNYIAKEWLKFSEKMKLNKTIYALKHTGIGMAFDNGINPRDLQLHIRHASLDETMKYLNRFRNITSQRLRDEFPSFS